MRPAVLIREGLPEGIVYIFADTPNVCRGDDELPFVAEDNVITGGRRSIVHVCMELGEHVCGVGPDGEKAITAVCAIADGTGPAQVEKSGLRSDIVIANVLVQFAWIMNTGLQEDSLVCEAVPSVENVV